MYYSCIRCNEKFMKKDLLIRHFKNKRLCDCKDLTIVGLNIDEYLKRSIIPKYDDEKETPHKCDACERSFSNKKYLFEHSKKYCKTKEILNTNTVSDSGDKNIVGNNNANNSYNTNCNNVNINININGFDEKWNISHIPIENLLKIILSKNKFIFLLKEIVKNIENINVNIDEDSDNCFVYKKITNSYEKKDINDVVKETLFKLKNQLHEIINNYNNNNDEIDELSIYMMAYINADTKILYSQYIANIGTINKNIVNVYSKK